MNYELWKVLSDSKENPVAQFFLEENNIHKFDTDGVKSDEEFLTRIITATSQAPSDAYVSPEIHKRVQTHLLENVDLRLEYLIVDGFRAIPYSNNSSDNPDWCRGPYGLAFDSKLILHSIGHKTDSQLANSLDFKIPDENNCDSFILLGRNGSGKTSLYSAIELICKGKIASEIKHNEENNSHRKELRNHISCPKEQAAETRCFNIKLKTRDEKYRLLKYNNSSEQNDNGESPSLDVAKQFISEIDLSQFFCSEGDLTIFECTNQSIDSYVHEICGLGNLDRAIGVCNNLISLDGNLSPDDERKPKLDQIIHHVINLKEKLEESLNTSSTAILKPAHHILETLLEDFKDEHIELDSNDGAFNGKLKSKEDNTQISPKGYYNNFRLKLYLLCLRIGLAFAIMKRRNIQFPLIFDDVFDSSDFPNRIYTRKFFTKILSLYSSLNISEKLLQIIFFTQDEVIAESVYNGICNTVINPKDDDAKAKRIRAKGNVILGRIFTADNCCKNDRVRLNYTETFDNLFDSIKINKYYLVDEN